MLVAFEQNRFGHVTIEPVNKRIRAKIVKYLESMKYAGAHPDESVYLQVDMAIETMYDDFNFTADDKRWLSDGWEVRKRVEPWVYLNYVGYNAADDLRL